MNELRYNDRVWGERKRFNMKTDTSSTQIDLVDMLKQLLLQWRPVLAVGLVFAFLIAGEKSASAYNKALKNSASTAKETADLAPAEDEYSKADVEEARKKLSAAELLTVVTDLTTEEQMLQMEDYLEHSFLMRIDPFNKHVLNIQYTIEGVSPEKARLLCEAYVSELSKDSCVASLGQALGCGSNIDLKYVRELLSFDYSGASQVASDVSVVPILYVTVVLPDGIKDAGNVDVGNCVSSIDQSIQVLQAELAQKMGNHTVVQLSAVDTVRVDLNLHDKILDNQSYVSSMKKNLQTGFDKYTEDQKIVFTAGLTELEKIYGDISFTSGNQENAVDKDLPDTAVETKDVKPEFSKRYFLFGFLMGIVIYVLGYVLFLSMGGRIGTLKGVEEYTGLPGFGESHSYAGRAKNAFLRFVWDKRLFEKMYAASLAGSDTVIHGTASKITTAIRMQPSPASKVTILTLEKEAVTVKDFANVLTSKVQALDSSLSATHRVSSPQELSMHSDEIANLGAVVLLCQRNRTARKSIYEFCEMAGRYHISVIGTVFAE